tara:strand:- start:131 stop:835 length:705 start_codon:yes stop_codon:yes gene_type:complete
MLPKRRIGEPKTEHWIGLIDGIYAISLTLMAIEVPRLLSVLSDKFNKNPESITILTFILIYETISYIATFLILYEIWSFHKGAVVIGGLKRRGQNFLNCMILVFSCLIPGEMIHLIELKTNYTLNQIDSSLNSIDKAWVLLNSYETSSQMLFIICMISFSLLFFLVSQNTIKNNNLNLLGLKKGLFNRSIVFFIFIIFGFASNLIAKTMLVPPLFLLIGYLIYAYYEKEPIEYN